MGWEREATLSGAPPWLRAIADPVRLTLLLNLSQVEQATAAELRDLCQAGAVTVRRHLDAMVAIGLVEERAGECDGETPGRPAARFSLAPAVRSGLDSLISSPTDY